MLSNKKVTCIVIFAYIVFIGVIILWGLDGLTIVNTFTIWIIILKIREIDKRTNNMDIINSIFAKFKS